MMQRFAAIAVAAQDHGYSPKHSNRLFRFEHWRRLLTPGSKLADHFWRDALWTWMMIEVLALRMQHRRHADCDRSPQ